MSSQVTLHLVDSIEYAESNCFQHQLLREFKRFPNVITVPLDQLNSVPPEFYQRVACCLKQRTVAAKLNELKTVFGRKPFTMYDQDPWHAFMDDSPYKGVYHDVIANFNLRAFAVTTQLWADFLAQRHIPSLFVKMGVLPEYCDVGPKYEDRQIKVGFIGTVHPYRQKLFDDLEELGVQVNVQAGNTLGYRWYMKALSSVQTFIHSEDSPIIVDGKQMNLATGLWIKDIEAMSRGCFSVRNVGGDDHTSYFSGLPKDGSGESMVRLYKNVEDVPAILEGIEKMDSTERQSLIDRTVEYIRQSNEWQRTATKLVTYRRENK